jgi:hypothetical protein
MFEGEYTHEGDQCTFEVMTRRLGLQDPLAAGFEAIAVGYSLRFPDDLENIERQFEVYDALYAWCRLDVARSAA